MLHVSTFLRAHGIRLERKLGQHFLISERVLERIIEAANLQPTDHVLEVGAGIGVLTRELTKRAGKVTAIELDRRLIPLLREYVETSGQRSVASRLTLVHGDALQVPLPTEPYKVVANIPYEITSPLLDRFLLQAHPRPTSLTLLLQREVAEKITTVDNRLAILVQLFGKPRIVCRVPRGAFLPPPAVESAVVHIACHRRPLATPQTLQRVLILSKIAFGGRRKMLRSTIGKLPHGLLMLERSGIDTTRRPETLHLTEWLRLGSVVIEISSPSP